MLDPGCFSEVGSNPDPVFLDGRIRYFSEKSDPGQLDNLDLQPCLGGR